MSTETPSYRDPVLGEIIGYACAEDFYAACEAHSAFMADVAAAPYYAVGHNITGYLPECDVVTFSDFDSAKAYLISEILWTAEYAETETIAEDLAALAEDVNLWSGPDTAYVETIDSPHCIPTAFWIYETDEMPEDGE